MCLGAAADGLPYRGRQNGAQRRGGEHQRSRRLLIDEERHHAAEKTADLPWTLSMTALTIERRTPRFSVTRQDTSDRCHLLAIRAESKVSPLHAWHRHLQAVRDLPLSIDSARGAEKGPHR